MFVTLDKCVLHPDCLAKYAAAFLRNTRRRRFLQGEAELGCSAVQLFDNSLAIS
ncbi:hypothetical protein EDF71_1481, partial [Comamonas sp. JUb58]